ncbi:MAG: dihydroorotate dehydrogenase-like protein [Chitinophagaceae bacterium]|nr:dihydroorotate dehydrogenase-like protein [Chitinophagaceae bacterium]
MNLRTSYMGLKLESPIVVSACTLSEEVGNIVQMEDAGAGAVVLFSLFEEQIKKEAAQYETIVRTTSNMFAEASDFFPDLDLYHKGPGQYLETIRKAKERVKIPVIGSLNGITNEGWISYARQMEQAGADGIEINIFFIPGDVHLSTSAVEHRYLNIIDEVKNTVKIPVAVKLNPYFSALGNMAMRMHEYGADALVLFNRFYQPDFDINKLALLHNLQYSESTEIKLPLLWIALLYGRVPVSLAATTGVQSSIEVIKYLLAGADVAMTASALYKQGIGYIKTMNKELDSWMHTREFDSIDSFKGVMSQQHISDPTSYERANYIKILEGQK